jgi:hypothetical protein
MFMVALPVEIQENNIGFTLAIEIVIFIIYIYLK